jgi:hypothetical protein
MDAGGPSRAGRHRGFHMPACPQPKPRPLCRHCRRRQAAPKRRGLCQRCHLDRAVRALYPENRAHPPRPSLARRLERHPRGDLLTGGRGPVDTAAWEEYRRRKKLPKGTPLETLYEHWFQSKVARSERRRKKRKGKATARPLPGTADKLTRLAARTRGRLPLFGGADAEVGETTAAVPVIASNGATVGRAVADADEHEYRRAVQAREAEEARRRREAEFDLPPPRSARPAPPDQDRGDAGEQQVVPQADVDLQSVPAGVSRRPPRQHVSVAAALAELLEAPPCVQDQRQQTA